MVLQYLPHSEDFFLLSLPHLPTFASPALAKDRYQQNMKLCIDEEGEDGYNVKLAYCASDRALLLAVTIAAGITTLF